jgi:S-adenosylmethionine hydrolase
MPASLPPVTLTTDFGLTDHYVAEMKGVIVGLAPGAALIDVTHAIPPQDVRRAAFLIAELAAAFPAGTVHLAVVDPGVGSERAILAVSADEQFYIAPDNGLLTFVLRRNPGAQIACVTSETLRRKIVTNTFHGRDVMAPAAAHLLNRVPFFELGPRLDRPPIELADTGVALTADGIRGDVAWIDHFGNLVTNIEAKSIGLEPERVRARFGSHVVLRLHRFYAEVPQGEPLLLVGSSGRLEIAVNGGNAARFFGAFPGMHVAIDAC